MHTASESFHVITSGDRSSFTAMKTETWYLCASRLFNTWILHVYNAERGDADIHKWQFIDNRRVLSIEVTDVGCFQNPSHVTYVYTKTVYHDAALPCTRNYESGKLYFNLEHSYFHNAFFFYILYILLALLLIYSAVKFIIADSKQFCEFLNTTVTTAEVVFIVLR
jgi:hypothetical protein